MGLFDSGFGELFSNLFSSGPEQLSGPASSGVDWGSLGGGLAGVGKDIAGAAIPAAAGIGTGMLINKLMPGTPAKANLVDTRQGVTQTGANMALDRARNIQANPESFGLPGDPNDPNSPAGKKRYDIVQGSRNADAARGMFSTGGSAARETNALNTAVGNEYNKVWGDSMSTLASQPAMSGYLSQAEENPWAKLLGGAVSPAVSKGMSSLLANWGMGS